jgi:hypothetical protein
LANMDGRWEHVEVEHQHASTLNDFPALGPGGIECGNG